MRPSSKTLALRDPALAALMGAIPGADFGGEMGYEFGDDSLDDDEFHVFGYEFGDDYGDVYGADAAPAAAVPPPSVAAKLWAKHRQDSALSERRARLIEPNKGSKIKVERYAFAVNQTLTLGTSATLSASGQPDTNIRPQRVTMNAPAPGFCTITEIKVANVSVTVGGTQDAFDFSSLGVGQSLDMPTLTPANRASVLGSYTGFVPPGYSNAASFTFCCSFKGPASIVA